MTDPVSRRDFLCTSATATTGAAFACGAVGTVIGTIVAFQVVPLGEEGWKLASIFSATYIGGMPEMLNARLFGFWNHLGAALKTGFSQARGEWLGFLDADGTYPPEHFPRLCQQVKACADLVVGSRRSGPRSSSRAMAMWSRGVPGSARPSRGVPTTSLDAVST